ncbi:MAG TPA: glycosyltransferase [Chitinophagales bacterium]|nr:glycosyltransferase [Chitinophagales bacterium]
MTEVLYMSYDGMTDPLGQSQVIPYIKGLSKLGYHFTLISFEKKDRLEKFGTGIATLLKDSNIDWVPLSYTKSPPVLSTIYDAWRMRRKAFELHGQKKFSIVHCRSYISALVGLAMKKKFGTKFIFDMRGFYADERVDGGLWKLDSPLYKTVYDFFKRKEVEFLTHADHTISLTENGKRIIHSWAHIPNQPVPIQVIPCCADLDKFSPESVDHTKLQALKNELGIKSDDFVISYLGSVGTWYMLDEMLAFFKCLLEKKPGAKFLFITNEPAELVLSKACEMQIAADRFIITPAPSPLVPTYLSLSSISFFFIKPVFSKQASSPTKQGEIMGMGIPYICNTGVGDVDEIVKDTRSGYLVDHFTVEDYRKTVNTILTTTLNANEIRQGAFKYYSLTKGVDNYNNVYCKLLSKT